MPTPPVTLTEFKARFTRDFVYGTTADKVMDADVTNALNDATLVFNEGLFADTLEIKTAFLFAAAHFLVLNVQAAGGLSAVNRGRGVKSRGGGAIQNKAVDGVSVGFAVSPFVTDSPILSQFLRTDYGQKYLALVTPRLVGNVAVVSGPDDTGSADV